MMTRIFLYSYPLVVVCLVAVGLFSIFRSAQHSMAPMGYCTASGENLPEDEKQAVALAKRFVERTRMGNAWELDGRFRVQADAEGYQVHVLFVSGYGITGKPILIPGGHCMVNISRDGSVEFGKAPGPSYLDANIYQNVNEVGISTRDNCGV